jgi:hypothetical protein
MKQRRLTKDIVREIAVQFTTRSDFQRGDKSAYLAALRNDWLDELCTHMHEIRRSLTLETISDSAKKFRTRTEFKQMDVSGYRAAIELGCLDKVCAHMTRQRRSLSHDAVLLIAKTFPTRASFQCGDGSAYNSAYLGGYLEEACAHMERAASAFNPDKAAYLYQIRLDFKFGTTLWKVGITNRDVKWRIRNMGIPKSVSHEVTHAIRFESGHDAISEEKRLHLKGHAAKIHYKGSPLLLNGNTELFYEPLLPC